MKFGFAPSWLKAARIAMSAAVILLSGPLTAGAAYAGNGGNGNSNPGNQVTICHSKQDDNKPYDQISVNANGSADGHDKDTGPVWDPTLKASHTNWGDIIPPFDYTDNGQTLHYAGLNWDTAGQAIYNNGCDVTSTLTVIKHVVGGGPKVASDFTMTVTGTNVSQSSFAGAETGTTVTLTPGSYSADEISDPDYAENQTGSCSGSILAGQNLTCTITNAFTLTTGNLVVYKEVSGGTKQPSDFQMHVTQNGTDVTGSPQAGDGTLGNSYDLVAGNYAVSEDADPNYTASFSGDCDTSGNVTLAVGDEQTCTVTNTYSPIFVIPEHSLTVKKIVVGGAAQPSDFQMHVMQNGADITGSPQAGSDTTGNVYAHLFAGNYDVSETSSAANLADYQETFSGDCPGGVVTLSTADVTCTVTNTYVGQSGGQGGTGGNTGSGGSGGNPGGGQSSNPSDPGSVLGAATGPATLPATGAESDLPWLVSLLGALAAYWVTRRREALAAVKAK